jgi:HlyD family secretion protein
VVAAGQIVAVLDSSDQLQATLRQTEARVGSAKARLAQASVGAAKTADIAAQKIEISRMEIELANAQTELRRVQMLHNDGIATAAALDSARLLVDTRQQMVNNGKERLRALDEVRPIDLDVLAAQVKEAEADVVRARAEFEAATIRSPIDGRVLKVHAWPGAEVGPNGLVEIARTQKMYVVAEVAQTDISRVRIGQRARITGDGIAGALEGTVASIGTEVARNSSTFDNPRTLATTRVVEVKIALDDAAAAERMIHAQVEVRLNVQ